ncbi:hypothetical protein BKC07_04445 [Peribacillus simplex]|nr:hypothetical protein BKC07_04445 [Peribacillus simplex]
MNRINPLKKDWFYLISILVFIMLEPYTYISMYKINTSISLLIISFILVAGYMVKYITSKKVIMISVEKLLFMLLLVILLLLNKLLTNDNSAFYFILVITIGLAYFATELFDFIKFKSAYSMVISFLCLFSIIVTYTVLFFPNLFIGWLPSIYHGPNSMRFLDAGLNFVYLPEYGVQYRNYSIFREPGVFQFYIIIALIFELWINDGPPKKSRIFLYCITLVSTFSTVGLITGIIVLFSYLISDMKNSNNKVKWLIGVFVFFIAFTLGYFKIPFVQEGLNDSFGKLSGGGGSMASRSGSLISYFNAWYNKPFIGWGYTRGVYEAGELYLKKYTEDNTNTIFTNLAFFGLAYGATYQYLLIKFVSLSKKDLVVKLIIFIVLMLTINSQRFIESMIIFMLLFYSISKKN